ncbi:hypothetical protein [Nonomuraea gerenzanensis]|uniref:Uncharacterized protein n=1 Tax=Nonomuraea gerenzanensis TaxID=93944 RepID=A0A1M4EGW1_9ACTN|nr:hypothetical protein [Nonomuraea gerenzanensis]UBU09765.1 hypothetical protein LCN96_36115 [Nonomuraea gerenzanensis]SBO98207.1 hypothetical protein BN4615_P7723 [Nonomuraea gerenzanensis]
MAAIGRVGQWLTDQAPDLYRRRDLAYEAEKIDVDVFGNRLPGAVVRPGLTRIDESRLIPAGVRAEAGLAASLMQAAARGDADATERLLAYHGRMSDPRFATALIEQLGAWGLVMLPAAMGAQVRMALDAGDGSAQALRRRNREVLSMLGKALATATDPSKDAHVTRRFQEELKRQGRAEIPVPGMRGQLTIHGYGALGQILAAAPAEAFSTSFMTTIGHDLIRWDRDFLKQHGEWPLARDLDAYDLPAPLDTRPFSGSGDIGVVDPVAALLTVAGSSRERAQALIGSRDLLTYLLRDRRPQWEMGDRGESLGEAMEAAMKGSDADSKRLAVMATQIYSDVVGSHLSIDDAGNIGIKDASELDRLSGARDNMARILAEHTEDMVFAHFQRHPRLPDDQLTGEVDGRATARFNPTDLDRVLLDVAIDDQAYQALLHAQLAHLRGGIDLGLATRDKDFTDNAIALDSAALGHLSEARRTALVGWGREADAADEALRKLVKEGVGLVPVPFAQQVGKLGINAADGIYESFIRDGYVKAGDWLVKQSGHAGGKTKEAYSDAASDDIAAQELVKQMLASSAVAHGAYRRDDLNERFVIGDPPRVKDPILMSRDEYDGFSRWLADNSTVPADFGEARQSADTGATTFQKNVRAGTSSDG